MKKINKIFNAFLSFVVLATACSKDSGSTAVADGNNTGTGGSMAKFTILGNYMYSVQHSSLKVYDVSNAAAPQLKSETDLKNSGVETIFGTKDYLFFGTQNGLLIYTLIDPVSPKYISTYSHVVSCDPVVVSGSKAYVTLSTGNSCNLGSNQLEVIDIVDIYHPVLMKTYPFENPKGLAVKFNYLFLCDEVSGFKVLNIADYNDIKVVVSIPDLLSTDVIEKDNILTITGKTGVYQYDCTDPLNLVFVSKIAAQQ